MDSPENGMRARRLVLLVDDCAENREMYAEYLGDEFAIAEAASGLEAIEQAVNLQPDLIVMDLTLPGMNGVEASHRIKRDPRTRTIPVLVVTGQSEPTSSTGPSWDAFLTKPCLPSVLAAHIHRALKNVCPVEDALLANPIS